MKQEVEAFRHFNRFYTRQIGLLNRTLLQSDFSLTQARILFELAHREECTASDLIQSLGIDRGYVSRVLHAFERNGLITRVQSKEDSRERFLKLTAAGKKAFAVLNDRSSKEAQSLLKKLPQLNREMLLDCMKTIENVLEPNGQPAERVTLRRHKPGDIGWMTWRHGILYSEEYGWDETFEALVAEILVKFIKNHDPERERIWIAQLGNEPVGCVMIVDAGDNVAQLRLLLVEPKARGKKIGKRLVDECISFAKQKGYRKMKLWTQSNLHAAREIYVKNGFELVEEKPHHSFGHDLFAQVWELPL
jgi:DNA-binding MarR family transcriptional regulator/GNAT superfamily N-acetyltransferase